jgi:hypothetical protein
MVRRLVLLMLLGLGGVVLGSGCGPGTATIDGEVTVDGKPLEKGVISYTPADGNGAPVTAEVRNGRYEVRTVAGRKVVQISAPIVVGQRKEHKGPGAALIDITEESLPPSCNSKSELTFEATAGANTKNWAVESKGRKP